MLSIISVVSVIVVVEHNEYPVEQCRVSKGDGHPLGDGFSLVVSSVSVNGESEGSSHGSAFNGGAEDGSSGQLGHPQSFGDISEARSGLERHSVVARVADKSLNIGFTRQNEPN